MTSSNESPVSAVNSNGIQMLANFMRGEELLTSAGFIIEVNFVPSDPAKGL